MVIPSEKLPVSLVVVVPIIVVVSKVAVTVSWLPKLVPLMVSVVVGGPVTCERVMCAPAAVFDTRYLSRCWLESREADLKRSLFRSAYKGSI